MDNIDYLLIIQALKDRLVSTKRRLDGYVESRQDNHKFVYGSLERDKILGENITELSMWCQRLENLIEHFEEKATDPSGQRSEATHANNCT